MTGQNFTTAFSVNQTPKEAFDAIRNVRGWCSEQVAGDTGQLGDEFIYRYQDAHRRKIKLVEVVPDRKIVWPVLDNYFSFTEDESARQDTRVTFEMFPHGNQTEVRFAYLGLVPNLIATCIGQPNRQE